MDGTVGTEAKMTICFIKTVSSLLALVSAVQENNFERHLREEREMVKYCFAKLRTLCVSPTSLSARTTRYQ